MSKWERALARLFMEWAADVDTIPVAAIARYVETNDVEGLIAAINTKPKLWIDKFPLIAIEAGNMAVDHLRGKGEFAKAAKVRRSPTFSITRQSAAEKLRNQTTRALERIESEQRKVITETIARGVEEGKRPRDIAVQIKRNLPLTSKQERAVANYEWSLRTGNKDALRRELRDKRFDRTVAGDKVLTNEQIDKMVAGYRRKMVSYRAKTIAQTEAHGAINWARHETAKQSASDQDMIKTWITRRDVDVRDSHESIDDQKRGLDEPFVAPSGALLLTPGDTSLGATAGEVVNCRCFVDYSVG